MSHLPTSSAHSEVRSRDDLGHLVASSADARWFVEEVHAHGGQLKAYLQSAYPGVRDVDDVVQESYLRLWRRHAAKPIASAKNFLFTVARHLALDLLRHERASPLAEANEPCLLAVADETADTFAQASRREEHALLLEVIDRLPARCRQILIMRKLQGLPQKEIAANLGLSVQTVQVQVGRGMRRCEQFLREAGLIRKTDS